MSSEKRREASHAREQRPAVPEPGRTQTEAENGERSPRFPDESARTQDHAEGDPATIDDDLTRTGRDR